MPTIISKDDDRSLQTIHDAFFAHLNPLIDTCPWVKIGNLYVSLTITGNETWAVLVNYIARTYGNQKFAIASGRHGTEIGQAPIDEYGTINLLDPQLYQDDLAALHIVDRSRVTQIKIYDANDLISTTADLQGFTRNRLRHGFVVIYAWCYSITAMRNYTLSMPQAALQARKNAIMGSRVRTITQEDYDWAA